CNAPAHLSLGDVRFKEGDETEAIAVWERLVESSPDRAYLAFSRLESAYAKAGAPDRYPALCHKLIAANPQDWRARPARGGPRATRLFTSIRTSASAAATAAPSSSGSARIVTSGTPSSKSGLRPPRRTPRSETADDCGTKITKITKTTKNLRSRHETGCFFFV